MASLGPIPLTEINFSKALSRIAGGIRNSQSEYLTHMRMDVRESSLPTAGKSENVGTVMVTSYPFSGFNNRRVNVMLQRQGSRQYGEIMV